MRTARRGREAGMALVAAATMGVGALAGCGGASEEDKARDAVDAYVSALAKRDAAGVCDAVPPSLRAKADRAWEKQGETGGCPAALADQWKSRPPTALTIDEVRSTRLDGDRGTVAVEGTVRRLRQRTSFSVVREGGAWHVRSGGRTTTPDGRPVLTVPTEAMTPGLRPGQQVVEDVHAYEHAAPKVGDVVVAHPARGVIDGATTCNGVDPGGPQPRPCATPATEHDGGSVIKRVVAGPGDRLTFRGGHAIVNGRRASEPYADVSGCSDDYAVTCDYRASITIPPGHYYLVGDNRSNSDDSRFWGPAAASWITGAVR